MLVAPCRRGGWAAGGEEHLEGGSLAGLAGDPDGSLVAPDDALDRRQPQTPARELRREEGIEDLVQGLLIHAAAGVGNLQADIKPFRQILAETDARQVFGMHWTASVEIEITPPCSPRASEALMIRFMITWLICEASAWMAGRSGARLCFSTAFLEMDTSNIRLKSSTLRVRLTGSTTNLPLPE